MSMRSPKVLIVAEICPLEVARHLREKYALVTLLIFFFLRHMHRSNGSTDIDGFMPRLNPGRCLVG
jgi:hypothetical protein